MDRRALLSAALAPLAAACSPLAAFNRLSPKDPARRQASGLAYGDHPRQRLDVYSPRLHPETPAPVLVFFYGGSWDSGRRQDYAWVGQAFAARGFVTVVPDYRLVPEVVFPGFVEDAAAATAKAREIAPRFGGDPDRIVLVGHSAGAYIAVFLALADAYLRRAGLDPKAVRAAAGLAGPYDFYPFDVPSSIAAFGQAPDPRVTQPINFARADAPPLFLATGDKDTTVAPYHSQRLAAKQQALGAEAELKVYPGLDHVEIVLALSRLFRGKAPVLDDVTTFLKANV
ncbi:MAG TPA: alpha/beta hydrolase [Caulobacteraceae bacterium]|nr:alpha/beta hydrolase [Caulobacteraceae bacterium]